MIFFKASHLFLQFQLAALALTAPHAAKSFDLTTAPLSLSLSLSLSNPNPNPSQNLTLPTKFILPPPINLTAPSQLTQVSSSTHSAPQISANPPNNPPDPYYYKNPGFPLAVIFSHYRSPIASKSVIAAAEQGWIEAVNTSHGPKMPIGTATKTYTVDNAQVVFRPNAKMTWEMFQQACLWVMEVYLMTLRSEAILGFVDDGFEGSLGWGEVRVVGGG